MTPRKIYVPGVALEVTCLVQDSPGKSVISVAHRGEVVVVFLSPNEDPTARAMSTQQADKFASDINAVYQAVRDDAAIKEMEKEFDD